MADRLGLVTRYFSHECTWASLYLAEIAENNGLRPTVLARDVCKRPVSPYWDSLVVDAHKAEFQEWALNCSHIIWTSPPSPSELCWAQDSGIETVLLAVWDMLDKHHTEAIRRFDTIVFPYACAAEAICKHCGGTDSTFLPKIIPWDVPVPLGRNLELADTAIRVLVPLYDSQPARNHLPLFKALAQIALRVPDVSFVIVGGTRWSLRASRQLQKLCRCHPTQFSWVRQFNQLQLLTLYGRSQLTLWPASYEGLALVGLTSLCMGVPVVAWDIPPQNEYLQHQKNSLLLPCELQENWLGVPQAMADWDILCNAVVSLLHNRAVLRKMRLHASDGLAARKAQFQKGWYEILTGATS